MPLAPVNPSPSAPPAASSTAPVNPLISLIRSGFKNPAFTPAPPNPIVSMAQSGIKNPAFTPNPVVSMIQSGIKNPVFTQPPTTTYTTEPVSFDLSDISFGTELLPSPTLSSRLSPSPFPPNTDSDNGPNVHNTPGTLLACTSTTYTSWAGDVPSSVCDVIPSEFGKCRNFSDALAGKVVAVRPDKGQLCLLFDKQDCYGSTSIIAILVSSEKILEHLRDMNDASADRDEYYKEISKLQKLLLILRRRLEDDSPSREWGSAVRALVIEDALLNRFKQDWARLSELTDHDRRKGAGKALVWKFKKAKVAETLGRMERLKVLLEITLEMDHSKHTQAIEDQVSFPPADVLVFQAEVDAMRRNQEEVKHGDNESLGPFIHKYIPYETLVRATAFQINAYKRLWGEKKRDNEREADETYALQSILGVEPGPANSDGKTDHGGSYINTIPHEKLYAQNSDSLDGYLDVSDDESERASVLSQADSIWSRASLNSAVTGFSGTSGYSAVRIETATKELLRIFLEHEHLASLYRAAIVRPRIGPERLQRNVRRLLKVFAEDLLAVANRDLERLAARLVSHKAAYVAQSVIEKYEFKNPFPFVTQILGSQDEDQKDEGSSDEEAECKEEEDLESHIDEDLIQDLSAFRQFLSDGHAFAQFQRQLEAFVQPRPAETKSSAREEKHSLDQVPILEIDESETPPSLGNKPFKMQRFWNLLSTSQAALKNLFVAAGYLEPPLESGKRCGDRFFGDVQEYRTEGVKDLTKKMSRSTGAEVTVTPHSETSTNQKWNLKAPVWSRLLSQDLMHMLYSPQCIDDKETWVFDQVPKRTVGELQADAGQPAEGWGIYYEEGFDFDTIIGVVLLVFFLASLLFAILWTRLEMDIQGAFGVSSYMATASGILLAWMASRARNYG
ncbi:hypothetical protein E8E13_002610 [Curvularia kusanoi]|uniref:Uncharacterized protein n=1 Tax=Curvularia kusanoi TaxID=90978 RepID=A0A9P4T5I6_CURKU|nr:hypothetical protein E8E13_002610 [Curvularia kusanoi]